MLRLCEDREATCCQILLNVLPRHENGVTILLTRASYEVLSGDFRVFSCFETSLCRSIGSPHPEHGYVGSFFCPKSVRFEAGAVDPAAVMDSD